MRRLINYLMKIPFLYNATQWLLAGPLVEVIRKRLETEGLLRNSGQKVLDVGCGPGTYSEWFACSYVGIDLQEEYVREARQKFTSDNKQFDVMDATAPSFPAQSFDSVVSIGLYHHLDDSATVKSLAELRKLVRDEGKIYVIDAIFPPRLWRNPLGYVLRKLDRGRFVRTYQAYVELLRPFDVKTVFCGRAGLLDYIYYEI